LALMGAEAGNLSTARPAAGASACLRRAPGGLSRRR